MISAGIDIGSRTVKVVVVSERHTVKRIAENTFDPLSVCTSLLEGLEYDTITATGYGRHLFGQHFECNIISEIKAFSMGVRAVAVTSRTILDIGGQDIKAISLDQGGNMRKFEMNDKCSAGTGRFLEIMALALGCSVRGFGELALTADNAENVSSMCTVFAESEVISLLAKGAPRNEIALGIHKSIIGRAKSMLQRVSLEESLAFVGGVSLNRCIVCLLEESLGVRAYVPDAPQLMGALGCALHGLGQKETAWESS